MLNLPPSTKLLLLLIMELSEANQNGRDIVPMEVEGNSQTRDEVQEPPNNESVYN
jgi:hypothetical protein